jgi:hypothetical protein
MPGEKLSVKTSCVGFLHEADCFLRNWYLFGWSLNSSHCMRPESFYKRLLLDSILSQSNSVQSLHSESY